MTNKLIINSNNPDYVGTFTKSEVEKDMRDLGCPIDDDIHWMYYIFDHVFDDTAAFTPRIAQFIVECESVKKITLDVEGDDVTIKKQ